ncbi:MAG: hypothetical protein ACOYON_11965 [Fimbriimonas sp.]
MNHIPPEFFPIFIIMMVPIVAILTRHQQRMAQIIHGSNAQQLPDPAIARETAREVSELRQLVHQQAIAIDNLTHEVRALRTSSQPVEERLKGL